MPQQPLYRPDLYPASTQVIKGRVVRPWLEAPGGELGGASAIVARATECVRESEADRGREKPEGSCRDR